MKSDWTDHDSWDAVPASVPLARGFVTSQLERHALTPILNEVRLVASELATNAVVHARTPFTVTLARQNGLLRLTVKDGSAALPTLSRPEPSAGSGRGLFMVATYSADWGVTPEPEGGKSVWATFSTMPS
jgi:anti-sigma regulatory factor (Ser/Thr protein kinase)